MDGLRHQHAATVAGQAAAARFVAIALRSPPPHRHIGTEQAAKFATRYSCGKGAGSAAQPVLQHHAEQYATAFADIDISVARVRLISRFLNQHVFAGTGKLPDDVQMRVGQCQHQSDLNLGVFKDVLQAACFALACK